MSHSADKIRVLGNFFLLFSVIIFFLPVLSVRQENYPEQTYSQFSFLKCYLAAETGDGSLPVSGGIRFMAVLLILIPLLLAVLAVIFRLIGYIPDQYSMICALAAGCLYMCQLLFGKGIWPKRLNDAQQYDHRIGWWLLLVVAFAILITQGISLLITRQERASEERAEARFVTGESATDASNVATVAQDTTSGLPEISPVARPTEPDAKEEHTISQTQTEINLSLFSPGEVTASGHEEAVDLPQPKGVMVGISGVFAQREIAFQPGETLRLGRDLTNDLVFTDAAHVSRNHCLITWQAAQQKYLLEDRSSNGCFINGAQTRLPKNVQVALDPGTVLDIGDRTNRFRLE